MKHISKINKTLFFFVFASFLFLTSSCTKEKLDPGSVYLKIISTPSLAQYNDDNDCIPFNFNEGEEYGVCEPGTFTYSFRTEKNASGNYWYLNNGTYTIIKEEGKRRVYTLSLGPTISFTYKDN